MIPELKTELIAYVTEWLQGKGLIEIGQTVKIEVNIMSGKMPLVEIGVDDDKTLMRIIARMPKFLKGRAQTAIDNRGLNLAAIRSKSLREIKSRNFGMRTLAELGYSLKHEEIVCPWMTDIVLELEDFPITGLKLTPSTKKAIYDQAGIRTVGELRMKPFNQLRLTQNVGSVSLREVYNKVLSQGLRLDWDLNKL